MEFFQKNEAKDVNTISIYKFVKEAKGIRIFTEVLNQGTLS
jgi:lipid-binding SYLF domain-containing protein